MSDNENTNPGSDEQSQPSPVYQPRRRALPDWVGAILVPMFLSIAGGGLSVYVAFHILADDVEELEENDERQDVAITANAKAIADNKAYIANGETFVRAHVDSLEKADERIAEDLKYIRDQLDRLVRRGRR